MPMRLHAWVRVDAVPSDWPAPAGLEIESSIRVGQACGVRARNLHRRLSSGSNSGSNSSFDESVDPSPSFSNSDRASASLPAIQLALAFSKMNACRSRSCSSRGRFEVCNLSMARSARLSMRTVSRVSARQSNSTFMASAHPRQLLRISNRFAESTALSMASLYRRPVSAMRAAVSRQ